MRLSNRINRLERDDSDPPAVFARFPENWSQERGEDEVRQLAMSDGIAPPFHVMAFPQMGIAAPKMTGVSSIQELLDYVAKHGKRIGGQR